MSFADAVRSVLTQYATFSGRARRSEYWWYYLFYVIVIAVANILDYIIGTSGTYGGVISGLVGLALLVPTIAVSVRRFHDIGKSGWFILLFLIPIVGFILWLVWFTQDSHGDNEHGPNPKGSVEPIVA
jgi:uncharacterized membrane protein YhaH (DUF805 family)